MKNKLPRSTYRVTFRNTRGKPGFKDVLPSKVLGFMRDLHDKGYTMIVCNADETITVGD